MFVVVGAMAVWLSRKLGSVEAHVPVPAGATLGTVARRAGEVATAAVSDSSSDATERVTRWRRLAGDGDDRLSRYQAAAALSAAQKAVAAIPMRGRGAALDELDAARLAILADLG